jgi:hypothetical protein
VLKAKHPLEWLHDKVKRLLQWRPLHHVFDRRQHFIRWLFAPNDFFSVVSSDESEDLNTSERCGPNSKLSDDADVHRLDKLSGNGHLQLAGKRDRVGRFERTNLSNWGNRHVIQRQVLSIKGCFPDVAGEKNVTQW